MDIPKADYLRVKVTPRSNKTELKDILEDGTIKIRLHAPAEKGKANDELIKFLASELHLHRDKITIISGKSDQLKLIKVNWN